MQEINPDSENILILALTGPILPGIWLAYKLNLFKFISTIDEKKILLPSFLFLISPFLFPFIFKIIFNNNMISQPTAINGGILGTLITGFFLVINTQSINSVNNKLQLEREEQQHIRQLEREEQQRIWQEKSDQKKWYREKIYDSYRKSIQILTDIAQVEFEAESNYISPQDKYIKLHELWSKLHCEFDIIIIGYPVKDFEEFTNQVNQIRECIQIDRLQARTIINRIMENDSRIKD